MITRWADVGKPGCDARGYALRSQHVEHPSSIVWTIICPFCGATVKAFLWSLSGGGKRCGCGALFGKLGIAYRRSA